MTIPFNPETKLPPYGVTDFERIICDNYYYVDKTNYIPLLERVASFFFIVRPRRFGKSLFLNMLESYYDIRRADTFEKTFGQLYIGQHPTANRSKYLVLKLNFSVSALIQKRCRLPSTNIAWPLSTDSASDTPTCYQLILSTV